MEKTQVNSQSVKSFMESNGYVQVVNHVRKNTNGYPFVTMINANNEAQNVYFTKAATEKSLVAPGDTVGKGFFADLVMYEVALNETGEMVWKIGGKGESQRVELSDLF